MSIKDMYEYVFYKIYKSMDFTMSWGADWRAGGLLNGFMFFIPGSLFFYYKDIFNNAATPSLIVIATPGVVIYILNHYLLFSQDQWKNIIKKFDAWPRKKNFIGTLIVWSIIALVIANFILAIHFYDQVN